MNRIIKLKKSLIILLFLSAFSFPLTAGSQWDITLNVPYYAGLGSLAGSGGIGDFSQYLFLVPDVKWNWYFGSDKIHFGLGLRLWTLLLESAVYPIVSLESFLGNFVLNANVGGGVFLLFGLLNNVYAEPLIIPEISVAYRFGKKKNFGLGTGAMFLLSPGSTTNAFAFVGTVFARFTF